MDAVDVLADYLSDGGERVRVVVRMTTRMGEVGAAAEGADDLEKCRRYPSSCIEVHADGRRVEVVPLRKGLGRFSWRDTNELLGEINALKDSHADPEEVVGELHALLG